jgi:hypothetical protein
MEIFVFWFLFSIAVAVLASNRGRSGFLWFIFSILLSPLLGVIFVLVMENLKDIEDKPNPNTHVRCPDCRELVRNDARKCKHCGVSLIPLSEQ